MTQVHYGHVFHVAGRPEVGGASAALTEIPDGALAIDDSGRITFCGNRSELPAELSSAVVHDHRAGFLLPGFVDTHIHFPHTYAGDSYGGGQLLEWLDQCIFPSDSRFANPEFATRAAAEFCDRRIAAGTTAAMVFGAAFPHAQDALFTETLKNLGEPYEAVRDRGVYVHTHLNENNRPGTGEVDVTKRAYGLDSYLDAYDGCFLPGSVVSGPSLLALGSGTVPWKRTVASGGERRGGNRFRRRRRMAHPAGAR